MRTSVILLFILCISFCASYAQKVALLHYEGGGDWYSNPSSLPNLINFTNQYTRTVINTTIEEVKPSSSDLFDYPYIFATGHGNILFSDRDIQNLRIYLLSGGFLHIDDNYGMTPYAKREIKRLFPEKELVILGTDHSIFKEPFQFPEGLPKIHEHDGKQPQAFGLFEGDRLILLLTTECDLGDGWEDREVHNNSDAIREKALKIGANILYYIFTK